MAPPKKPTGGLNLGAAPPPPAAKTKNQTTGAAFNAFINAHPTMRPYADQIYKWAGVYGVDKVVAAALFWRESFAAAKATGQDPATITSPKGAVGIGQIMPLHVGERTPWGATVSQSDLVNPDFNIRWSLWYFSQAEQKFGDPDAAYSQGYNPGYTGAALTSLLPKGYVPRAGLSPADKGTVAAETAAATATAKAQLNDSWAVLDKHGKLQYVPIADPSNPPKNVLEYAGQPLTESTFAQVWKQTYADTFQAYTGRKPKGAEIKQILATSPSVYTLANQLANAPGFSKSPIYRQHAPGLVEIGRQILGQNWNPSGGIIRDAIAQSWDQATFEARLRQLPVYRSGPEFKTNLAQNRAAFESIYGHPADAPTAKMIADKTAAGWTTDQFTSWLRQQPAYKLSPEYQSKTLGFLSQLGLITGQVPTLSADQVDKMLTAQDQLDQQTSPAGGGTVANPLKKFTPTPTNFISEHGQGGGYQP